MKEYKVIVGDNRTEWYDSEGELHRENGPAIEWASGTKAWYKHGKRHREDGPAVERSDGDKSWYFNGKLHREDGPAVEWRCGIKRWYLDGMKLSEEEFNQKMNPAVEMTLEEVCKALGKTIKIVKG